LKRLQNEEDAQRDYISDLIFHIYKASQETVYWGHVLGKLSSYVDGSTCITARDNKTGHVQAMDVFITKTHGFKMHFVDQYIRSICAIDPWVKIEQRHKVGQVCTFSEHLKRKDLVKTEFYESWLKPQNINDGVAIQLYKTEKFRIVLNVFFNTSNSNTKLKCDLEILVPHLCQSVEIWLRLNGILDISTYQYKEHVLASEYNLTIKEISIAYAYAYLNSRDEIASSFNVSPETIKSHLYNIRKKLGGGDPISPIEMKRAIGSFTSLGIF